MLYKVEEDSMANHDVIDRLVESLQDKTEELTQIESKNKSLTEAYNQEKLVIVLGFLPFSLSLLL